MKRLGLYLHIPFCRSKCHYCDFCSVPHPEPALVEAYVERLCADLRTWGARLRDYTVDTVYFGGGTPTLLPARSLCRLLDTVGEYLSLDMGAEITLECNPATGSPEGFSELRRAGFCRLSMGVQSVHKNELRALGRLHSWEDVCATYGAARHAGFDNISMDVMQGIPEQSTESYLDTLRALLSLSPEHISAYGLSVEEGTQFGHMGERLILPDEEASREMYFSGIELLESHGMHLYEISNFARAGYESRHNLKYWRCEEYLGLGPAAHSYLFGERFGNSRDIRAYIGGEDICEEREAVSRADEIFEYLMLRLRLCEGIDAADFSARFSRSLDSLVGKTLSRYVASGHVRRTANGYALTPEGMYLSNTVLSDLLDFDLSDGKNS